MVVLRRRWLTEGPWLQGFFTAVDFKALLRWSLTPADLEDLVAWAPKGGSSHSLQRVQDAYRVVMDPAMQVSSPLLAPAVLKVRWQGHSPGLELFALLTTLGSQRS